MHAQPLRNSLTQPILCILSSLGINLQRQCYACQPINKKITKKTRARSRNRHESKSRLLFEISTLSKGKSKRREAPRGGSGSQGGAWSRGCSTSSCTTCTSTTRVSERIALLLLAVEKGTHSIRQCQQTCSQSKTKGDKVIRHGVRSKGRGLTFCWS